MEGHVFRTQETCLLPTGPAAAPVGTSLQASGDRAMADRWREGWDSNPIPSLTPFLSSWGPQAEAGMPGPGPGWWESSILWWAPGPFPGVVLAGEIEAGAGVAPGRASSPSFGPAGLSRRQVSRHAGRLRLRTPGVGRSPHWAPSPPHTSLRASGCSTRSSNCGPEQPRLLPPPHLRAPPTLVQVQPLPAGGALPSEVQDAPSSMGAAPSCISHLVWSLPYARPPWGLKGGVRSESLLHPHVGRRAGPPWGLGGYLLEERMNE